MAEAPPLSSAKWPDSAVPAVGAREAAYCRKRRCHWQVAANHGEASLTARGTPSGDIVIAPATKPEIIAIQHYGPYNRIKS
ncbi:hypothetical protein J27TS7_26940 [Paenibacillus dendritiformis]|nr:hypothetical protein J27TS7_26940 [Paenibacillus dendritiformis]